MPVETTLARLAARPRALARARLHVVPRRAAAWAAALQLAALAVLALVSAARPYEGVWLQAAAATWLVWLVPLALTVHAAWRGRPRRFDAAVAAAAEESDHLNPGAPDVFRTALHPEVHAPTVRAALEQLFAQWEPRLRVPSTPRVFGGDRGGRLRLVALLLALLAAVVVVLSPLAFPRLGNPGTMLARMATPGRVLERIPAPHLEPRTMPAFVARGDTLRVLVDVRHVPDDVPVHARILPSRAGRTEEVRHELSRAHPEADTLTPEISPSSHEVSRNASRQEMHASQRLLRFGPVTEDLVVRFTARGASSPAYVVAMVEPPRLRSLRAVITPPAYTRLPSETIPAFSTGLVVVPGTRITWRGEVDRPLAAWTATWETDGEREGESEEETGVGAETGRRVLGQGSGDVVAFAGVVRAAGTLRVALEDRAARGGASRREGPWRVEVREDQPPEVTLEVPEGDGELPRGLKVGIAFRATDDFGVSAVRLHHELRDAQGEVKARGARVVTSWRDARDGRGRGLWDGMAPGVLPVRPQPGEVVELWVEAMDNDAVAGPKTARSGRVRLRLPSLDEVRADVAAREREASTALAGALQREARRQREEERPDRGMNSEMPPQLASEWEVRRILSEEPRRHLQNLQRQLDAEIRQLQAAAPSREAASLAQPPRPAQQADAAKTREDQKREEQAARQAKVLEALKKEVEAMERRVPAPSLTQASPREQARALENLNRDQKDLERRLKDTPLKDAQAASPRAERPDAAERMRRQNRERLEEELARQLADQEALKGWLAEEQRLQEAREQREAAAARQREQVRADVQDAIEQLETAMKKGLENGTLGPDLLEKMDRVRELLEEVLDEEQQQNLVRESLRDPSAGELERALREMSDRPHDMRRDLERAIEMLENLREAKALREMAADLRALEEKQAALAERLEKESPAQANAGQEAREAQEAKELQELAAQQENLARQLEAQMSRLDASPEKAARKDPARESARSSSRQAREEMKRTQDALRKPRPERKQGSTSAGLAAKKLAEAAAQMEQAAAQMDQGANQSEMRDVLEETLEFARWLEDGSGATVAPARDEAQAVARVARWLARRMNALAAARPFDGDVLKRAAASMVAHADALATVDARESLAGLAQVRAQARGAARELLKWLSESQEGGGGNDEGEGQGDNDFGGGEQGESGEEGSQGMARRMRGLSGQQMAANRLTEQLLRSMMEERRQEQHTRSGGAPGPGQTGGTPREDGRQTSGASGSGASEGGRSARQGAGASGMSGQSGEDRGGESGNGSTGSSGGSGAEGENGGEGEEGASGSSRARGAAANAQQQVADELESLAERADDAGGAARALRRLAEEARALERALRSGRLDAEELRKRQEQFRTRLLESADAQEERGQQRERRAEAYRGGTAAFEGRALPVDSLATELKRRREDARRLPLTPEQKRRVEWYYERLLGE